MILYYTVMSSNKAEDIEADVKVVVTDTYHDILNYINRIPDGTYLKTELNMPLYKIDSSKKIGGASDWSHKALKVPSQPSDGLDEIPEETNLTTEQATEIIKEIMPEVLEPNLDDRKHLLPDNYPIASLKGPFNSVEYEEVNKTFYIPKAVFTNITTGKYKTQKNLQLKTFDGISDSNINTYYKVKLVVEIPNEKVVQDPNELYQILINCGVNTKTAEVAVQTAMEK